MRYFVAGGAGFIGSHLTKHLLTQDGSRVTVFDNFSSGRGWHLDIEARDRITVIEGDLKDLPAINRAIGGHDLVFHLASNPDIARAATEPVIDFWEGTYLTQNLLEAMRVAAISRLVYASGSGIYGDTGESPVFEDYAPLLPISTYGASKLACEALICAYCHLNGLSAVAFRFANVVGPHQTHGVGYDFVRRLLKDPTHLTILGDGHQSKSYIHVDDVIEALMTVANLANPGFEYYNVATEDYLTVREIADLAVQEVGLANVKYEYTGGSRGWKGDVPVVRFDTQKLRSLGWRNRRTSREALRDSIASMITDARQGRFDA
jgi:UDP-glucose 4-epimerase